MAAEQAGADAIGINFYPPSPRAVDLRTGANVARAVAITRIGLFVDPEPELVVHALRRCELDMLQFHGDETPEFCVQFDVPYVKAVRMQTQTDIREIERAHSDAWALLLDTYVPGIVGGTGATFEWDLWPRKLQHRRLILAGGLTVERVAEAVQRLRPFGVDVSGGVEGALKGHKDHDLMRRFIQEARGAGGE